MNSCDLVSEAYTADVYVSFWGEGDVMFLFFLFCFFLSMLTKKNTIDSFDFHFISPLQM